MAEVTQADREKARELQADLGWQELAYPTPKQLIAYLRQCPDAVAEECASRLIAASQEASWCWQGNHERQLEYLRAALAEEREKARVPFLALAEELDGEARARWVRTMVARDADLRDAAFGERGAGDALHDAAVRIRRAAEESQ